MTTIDFTALLKAAAKRFASQQAFAEALGMSTPRLNRALNKGDYPFNVLNCLRLARLADAPPSEVLRAAGKDEIADLIEVLYGSPDETMTPGEREHLQRWRRLTAKARNSIEVLMRDLLPEEPAAAVPKRKKSA